jgi:hypothetical protein
MPVSGPTSGVKFFFAQMQKHGTISIMQHVQEAIRKSVILIDRSRASLRYDKQRIGNAQMVISRSHILLEKLSYAIDINQWLLAQPPLANVNGSCEVQVVERRTPRIGWVGAASHSLLKDRLALI